MTICWKVPPSRKQSPFIAKRPQLPPRVPGSNKVLQMNIIKGKQWPLADTFSKNDFDDFQAFSPPIGPHRKPAKPQKKLLQKPVELRKPILKKSSNPALKPAATVGVQQPSASIPEITLRPNGSNQPGSAIANHLSSLLTSFFRWERPVSHFFNPHFPPQHYSISCTSTSSTAFAGWGHGVCGRCQRYSNKQTAPPPCQKC